MKPTPVTHELTLNGVDGFVAFVRDSGKDITVTGWCYDHWKWNEGDYVILRKKYGNDSTRYKIRTIDHCGDPSDQYFMDLTFDPRIEPNKKEVVTDNNMAISVGRGPWYMRPVYFVTLVYIAAKVLLFGEQDVSSLTKVNDIPLRGNNAKS